MRLSIILFFLLIGTSVLSAQQKYTEIQAGALFPADAETGFIGGLGFGRMLDENIGWGLEAGVYRRTYTKDTEVPQPSQGQIDPVLVITEIENSTTMIPVYFKIAYLTQAGPGFDLRVSAGAGYEFLWNSVLNNRLGVEDTRFFSAFTWQIGAGLSLPISRSSDFFGEISYHGGAPSRDEGKTEDGLPVRTEVDMSGVMLRLGIRLYSFGF